MAEDSVKKLLKQQNNLLTHLKTSIDQHANQVETLTNTVDNGLARLLNSFTDGTAHLSNMVASAIGNVVVQLTAANSHAAQSNTSFTDIAARVAGINSLMDASSKAQKKKVDSHATDPMCRSIDLTTSAGIKAWIAGTSLPASIPTGLLVNTDSRKSIRGFFSHLLNSGFGTLLYVPDADKGNGVPGTSPNADGTANTNLSGTRNVLTHYANIERDEILKWSAYFHGGVHDGLVIPTTRIQKTLDVEATGNNGNDGLVAEVKIELRVRAAMLLHVIRTHIDPDSLEAFLAEKDVYTWTREDNSTEFSCGLTVAWLILEAIEPKTVIDAQEHENIIYDTTLDGDCKGDLKLYLSTVKVAKEQIDIRHKNRVTKQKYLEAIFKQVQKVKQPNFKAAVDREYTNYLTGTLTDVDAFLTTLLTIYTALTTAKTWTMQDPNEQKIVALSTQVKALKSANKKLTDQSKSNAGDGGKSNSTGPFLNAKGEEVAGPAGSTGYNVLLWRTKKTKQTIKKDGDWYHWCDNPVHYDGQGLYMKQNATKPGRHDHEEWQRVKDEKKGERAAKKTSGKKRKGDGDESSVDSSSSAKSLKGGKLTVKKPKKQAVAALVTQLNMDHHQAVEFCSANGLMTDGEDSDPDFG